MYNKSNIKWRNAMFYFAYGSNINMAQMLARTKGYMSYPIWQGIIEDYKLSFKGTKEIGYYATIEKAERHQVPVICYNLDERLVKKLDKYEGVAQGWYHEKILTVKIKSFLGHSVEVQGAIYIMNDVINNMPIQYHTPEPIYVAKISIGYHSFGLKTEPIQSAILEILHNKSKTAEYIETVKKEINSQNSNLFTDTNTKVK
jgi:gamma-glutamylcyclotransferase (GGCT)/AIG2-like uncharacterized protein YtfP